MYVNPFVYIGHENFVNGIPICAVSVGVSFKGDTKVAVIYDPYRDEVFSCIEGQGAKANECTCTVSLGDIATIIGVGRSNYEK
jgi:fructose-1,6-bisphosphatase/inositol monophosphatase family enzyme